MSNRPNQPDEPMEWSRRQFLLGVGAIVTAGTVATFGRSQMVEAARGIFGSPVSTGKIYIYAYDYYFVPNYMTWKVGDTITIAYRNRSQSQPGKLHEWMVGRDVNMIDTPLGEETANGFKDLLFNGEHLTVSHAHLVHDLAVGGALVSYKGPKPPNIHRGKADGFSPTLYPGGGVDITFTVPDKPGLWDYGCFVQHFEHYRLGMRGKVNIIRA